MEYEVITLRGDQILNAASYSMPYDVPFLACSSDSVLLSESYPQSALFDQLRFHISPAKDTSDIFNKVWVYVNFKDAFPLKDDMKEAFNYLFETGFNLQFPDEDECIRFVPFLNSAGQSKKYVYGFIKESLYSDMRVRLDLDFTFKDQEERTALSNISKLYGYRALYSSGATPVLHYSDPDGEDLFNEDSIVIIKEIKGGHEVSYYSADQKAIDGTNEVGLTPSDIKREKVELTCFDGAGIISFEGRDLINKHLPSHMKGQSFQVRMPFLKGVLHTVNVRKFLNDRGIDDKNGGKATVTDIFGRERDLFKAKIIITPSTFKLLGLLSRTDINEDVIKKYFNGIKKYDHGLYVVKTEASFHNTKSVALSSQLLSTFDITADDLDDLVKEHLLAADSYCLENLMSDEKRKELSCFADRDQWMTLLTRQPAFLRDGRIRNMLDNYRKTRYHDIALGRLRVEGENRFLCGDLLYFLLRLLDEVVKKDPKLFVEYKNIESRLMRRSYVYIPGIKQGVKEVALLRNPHLSRNEEVCAEVKHKGFYHYYDKYLSHLKGVIFVGHCSYIPAAMGGADFDGDHVIISYNDTIINACKKGYVEKLSRESRVPFINIPALSGGNAEVKRARYIVPDAVYNTFSNRIGEISNAAMKIAAVEYDTTLPVCDGIPNAAFCTILTGTEIDAAKKGLRPSIDDVLSYKGKEDQKHEEIVSAVETYIREKKKLESWGGRIPSVTFDSNGEDIICVNIDGDELVLGPNRSHNAVTQLLYRWAMAFKDYDDKPCPEFPDSLPDLKDIFSESCYEPEAVSNILNAYGAVTKSYAKKKRILRALNERCFENDKKIFMRLAGQYDNIDLGKYGTSYRSRMERLKNSIIELVKCHSRSEISELKGVLFSNGTDFEATSYWPYGQGLVKNDLLDKILSIPDAGLLYNFSFEGYRFLYYLLDDACVSKDIEREEERPDESSNNPYLASYNEISRDHYLKNSTLSEFEKKLREKAFTDICEAIKTTDRAKVIRQIYPPKTKEQQKSFWDIFTVSDMLNALGGDGDA